VAVITAKAASLTEAAALADGAAASATGDYGAAVFEAVQAADSATATAALVAALFEALDAGATAAAVVLAPGAYLVAIDESVQLADAASALRDPPQTGAVAISRTRRVVYVDPQRIVRLHISSHRICP
jgi:hypothetical protein